MIKKQLTRQEFATAALELGARPGTIRQWFCRGVPYRWQIRFLEHFGCPIEISDWTPNATATIEKPPSLADICRSKFGGFHGHRPPNRHYGAVLSALLQERNRYHRPTWIYTPNPIASATFQGLYGAAFAAVLETPELQLLHVTPPNGARTRAVLKAERQVPQLHDDGPQTPPRRAKKFSSSRQG
jgi:hypothetical protein